MAIGVARARACRRLRDHHGRDIAGADALDELLPLLWRAFDRYLSRLLPADGGDADLAAEDRSHSRHRHDFADRHRRRRRRRARDLEDSARASRQFPVRAPRRILDRAEEGRNGIAGGGVTLSPSSLRRRGPITTDICRNIRWCSSLLDNISLGLWVPAFAGTTAELAVGQCQIPPS